MAAPFSRLQLAAALLEYDNDPDNPDAPYRSAHESALFAHLRRHVRPPATTRKSSNYIGVALPSEMGGRDSIADGRRSRGSTFALRNPFGGEDEYLEEEEEEEPQPMDLDLASWGLDEFISKDKNNEKTTKGKAKAISPTPLSSVNTHFPITAKAPSGSLPQRRQSRSMSVGNYDHLTHELDDPRRKSISSPHDLAGLRSNSDGPPFQRHRAASFSAATSLQGPVVESIPFPSRSIRSPSPAPTEALRIRTYSSGSMDIGQSARPRTNSNGTMASGMLLNDSDNPFALQPPTRASRFDPKAAAHARTISNASLGSRMLLDNDGASVMTQQGRPYSTVDLLRPKVLVMPSPLQSLRPPASPAREPTPEGFQMSTDGPPLPPGARAARDRIPIASNSFIPNPRDNLTLSQMTFRDTLKVDGPGASNVHIALPRATEDGQQMIFEPPTHEELPSPYPVDENAAPGRPAGKLFGKSLIDDLESRKATMRGKQRVFRGDDRPTMMARGQTRSSTLIDPSSLGVRDIQRMTAYGSAPGRPQSTGPGPLLNFDNDQRVNSAMLSPGARAPNTRSVFGVDTLWEREMVRLKEIEAQEKAEEEELERREALEAAAVAANVKGKKKKKKGKNGGGADESFETGALTELESQPSQTFTPSALDTPPPVLPMPSPIIRGPPPIIDDDTSDSDDSDIPPAPKRKQKEKETQAWHSDSEDEDGPRKTTGVGLRNPKQAKAILYGQTRQPAAAYDDDSEDDIPLAAQVSRGLHPPRRVDSDSEEEKPLSMLIRESSKTKKRPGLSLPTFDFDKSTGNDEEEDEIPLGLRASHIASSLLNVGGDDDDRPLALHPDQQRRSQMVFAQQQHHQMMMQAQMHSSMFFNPSMMGSGFFNPPPPVMGAPMPMMPPVPPMQITSPPPLQDPVKFNRVDNWRHKVAVEGE